MTRRTITYVIAYDITDPRRLARVHRELREAAFPVQYSVFLATLDTAAIDRLLSRDRPTAGNTGPADRSEP